MELLTAGKVLETPGPRKIKGCASGISLSHNISDAMIKKPVEAGFVALGLVNFNKAHLEVDFQGREELENASFDPGQIIRCGAYHQCFFALIKGK